MSTRIRTNSFFSFFAGLFLSVFGRTKTKPTKENLQRAEFKTSTQRMGIRFNERIRDVFRFRWLRKTQN